MDLKIILPTFQALLRSEIAAVIELRIAMDPEGGVSFPHVLISKPVVHERRGSAAWDEIPCTHGKPGIHLRASK